jgi:hypothetical protein
MGEAGISMRLDEGGTPSTQFSLERYHLTGLRDRYDVGPATAVEELRPNRP